MNDDRIIQLTDRQVLADNALEADCITDVMYGGAKGGGKSFYFCVWVYSYCRKIIDQFELEPCKNPPHIGWMGRKQAVDFTGTTLETWKEVIPEEYYEIKSGTEKSTKHILIHDRVAVDFGGLDRQESVNKFNSAEYGFIAVDQAEETTRDDVSVLRASRRMKISGKHLPYKGLFTANPAQCWLKEDFILNPKDNCRFIRALPSDNPFLPDSYIQTLKDSFSHRPELLAAYLEGDWDAMDDSDQLIKGASIENASCLNHVQHLPMQRRLLTCDVARFGDDETVIYDMVETDIKEAFIYGQRDTMYTANKLAALSMERDDCTIVIDEGGVGGGVVDRLRELGRDVIAVNSAEKSMYPTKYYNKRAEVWDTVARMFVEGDIELHTKDTALTGQLMTPKYKFRNTKILIEPKDDIKKRLGRSPDRADAYVNGVWALKNVDPKEAKGGHPQLTSVVIPSSIGVANGY
ncbi:MAG: hypothetical protein DRP56_09130 [Planctomycetota bacterium]|nr:MAG: hypothetical protein DRP56_09130 [Planctomycetota bacterium]